jgi:hypothetical protein
MNRREFIRFLVVGFALVGAALLVLCLYKRQMHYRLVEEEIRRSGHAAGQALLDNDKETFMKYFRGTEKELSLVSSNFDKKRRVLEFEEEIAYNYGKEAVIAFYKINTVPGLNDFTWYDYRKLHDFSSDIKKLKVIDVQGNVATITERGNSDIRYYGIRENDIWKNECPFGDEIIDYTILRNKVDIFVMDEFTPVLKAKVPLETIKEEMKIRSFEFVNMGEEGIRDFFLGNLDD